MHSEASANSDRQRTGQWWGNSEDEAGYVLPVASSLTKQLIHSVEVIEALLDKWQNKIHVDKQAGRVGQYAFPELVKYLIIQYQEYLNNL